MFVKLKKIIYLNILYLMKFFFRIIKFWSVNGFFAVIFRILFILKLKFAKLFGLQIIKSIYGVPFVANYNDTTFNFYIYGGYSNFYWNRLACIKYKFIFLDIGANQGLYSICSAKNSNNVRSYAFEPVKDTYEFLIKNILLNKISHKCTAFKMAISDKSELTEIKINKNHSGAASLSKKNIIDTNFSKTLKINTINAKELNTLININNLPVIIKIDVEGHEPIVIKELISSKISNNIKEIFYEIDEAWVNPIEIEKILRQVGFKIFNKIGSGSHYDILALR